LNSNTPLDNHRLLMKEPIKKLRSVEIHGFKENPKSKKLFFHLGDISISIDPKHGNIILEWDGNTYNDHSLSTRHLPDGTTRLIVIPASPGQPDTIHQSATTTDSIKTLVITSNAEKERRKRLRIELMDAYKQDASTTLDKVISESKIYNRLLEHIANNQILKYDSPLWEDLERIVLRASPEFKKNLQILTLNKISSIEFHTAILIRCHLKPSQMAALLGISKGTIVSRRETLCTKIFDEKLGTKATDAIIRLL